MPDFTWRPAYEASTEGVEALFATGGAARRTENLSSASLGEPPTSVG